MTRIQLLDHGHVELIGSMGGDIDIVNGARQSFDEVSFLHHRWCPLVKDLPLARKFDACTCETDAVGDAKTMLTKKDEGLINFLMRGRHTSPFELVQVKLGVMLPIFVAREWMRHRTQSFNEMSGRYTQLPRLFYVPDEIREQKGKPGAYTYEPMEDETEVLRAQSIIRASCDRAFDDYEWMLERGVAKEQARGVLPVNTYTKMVVSANLLNWMRFLSLRNHPHAQHEIQVYAEAVESLLWKVAPVAMERYVEHGRLAAPPS